MLQTLFTAYPRLWLLIVSIIAQAIGAFWFGPLFGKTFMKEENWSEEDVKTLPMKPMWVMLLQEFLSRAVFFL
jgi:NADH:ubiquinone oxidoreductase subunit 5 (subunit L)/multisubunit Na+/H+ antiporter MnhA subunit